MACLTLCLSTDDNAGALRWCRNGDDNPHWIFTISLTHPCWQAWNLHEGGGRDSFSGEKMLKVSLWFRVEQPPLRHHRATEQWWVAKASCHWTPNEGFSAPGYLVAAARPESGVTTSFSLRWLGLITLICRSTFHEDASKMVVMCNWSTEKSLVVRGKWWPRRVNAVL